MRNLAAWMLWLVVSANASASGVAPDIAPDASEFDFGTVESQRSISHMFVLRNEGNAELQISNVTTTCGCTATELKDKTIAPGAEAEITVTLDLIGRRGPQRKHVRIHSNDPDEPMLTLTVEGHVQPPIWAEPSRLHLGKLTPGATVLRTVKLALDTGAYVRVLSVESDDPAIAASLRSGEAGAQSVEVEVRAPVAPTKLQAVVKVYTDTAGTFEVPVTGTVVRELAWSPEEVLLSGPPGKVLTRYVTISPGTVEAFQVTGVEVPDPSVQVDTQRIGDGYRVRLSGMSPDLDWAGKTLTIKTDVSALPEIRIPIITARVHRSQGSSAEPMGEPKGL